MTQYILIYSPQAKRGIEKLQPPVLKNIAERVMLSIAQNPFKGTKLVGKLAGFYSARITRRYRVIYCINTATKTVLIIDVAHRRESYR